MSTPSQGNHSHERRLHKIGEDDTSNSEDCLVIGMDYSKGSSLRATETARKAVISPNEQAAQERQDREVFKQFISKIKLNEVADLARKLHIPPSCQAMLPTTSCHAAYPPKDFIAISLQHLESGFRFPVAPFLIDLLNDLKLAPFQLTPNSYAQLTWLSILFLSNNLSPPSPRIIRFLYSFKAIKEGLYYLTACSSNFKSILPQGKAKGKSNVGDYKSHWFFISCRSLSKLKNFSFAMTPGKSKPARA